MAAVCRPYCWRTTWLEAGRAPCCSAPWRCEGACAGTEQGRHVGGIEHPTLSVEVGSRKTLPAWIREAMGRAEAAALPAQLPIKVFLHRDRDRYAYALVVVRLKRFVQQLGE